MNKYSLESERRAPPLPPPARPAESVACWDREVPAGAPHGGRVDLGPSLLCCVGGEAFTVCSAQLDPSQTSLTPASVCSLSAHFRTQRTCLFLTAPVPLGFCRPDVSITPSAWRTDAAAQSSFLQTQIHFLLYSVILYV